MFTNEEHKQLILERKYIENPAIWDSLTQSYVTDYCTTYITTEQTYTNVEPTKFYGYELLALSPHINKDTLDTNCFNLHPTIASKPNEISINNRSMSCNFKEGFIFLRYNSLPEIDGEIAIPQFSTGDIYNFIFQMVKVNIIENIILNNKNATVAGQLYPSLKAELRELEHKAQCESKYSGLSKGWDRKMYKQRLINRKFLNL
jgi:hypothetical protein